MPATQKYWCVVPAAGKGLRMEADIPKQYLSIEGKTILEHCVERLASHSLVEKVVVVVGPDDLIWSQLPVADHPKVLATRGGEERSHSVLNGLKMLADFIEENDWVLVHDAVRPCVRLSDINLLIESLSGKDEVGGILACPQHDTMKKVNEKLQVEETVDRSNLWRALTPQMFKYIELKNALNNALDQNKTITDECSAMELMGFKPKIIEGASDNIKITTKKDLSLARLIIQQQSLHFS